MRVISGSAKGRTLKAVPGDSTRPILDRAKVPLFDILRSFVPNKQILDLFGGTGQIGIEGLSQGAAHCVFCDTNARAIATMKDNLATTQLSERAEVRHTDAFVYLKNSAKVFDLIFVAPPQFKGIWIEAMRILAERPHLLADDGKIVVQIDPKEYEPIDLTALHEDSQRKYGNTLFLFYSKQREMTELT